MDPYQPKYFMSALCGDMKNMFSYNSIGVNGQNRFYNNKIDWYFHQNIHFLEAIQDEEKIVPFIIERSDHQITFAARDNPKKEI